MNRRVPHMLIGACSLAGVMAVAVVDMGRSSPGQVARVHGLVDDLNGGQNCNACHGSWIESMGDACLECHQVIADHLEFDRGLHGRLADVEADRCSTCHSEHHGANFAVVNLQSFARAGVADPTNFDHGMVGFEMGGKHLELDCTECHEYAEVDMVPEGNHRFIGLAADCASCHDDPHEGSMRQTCSNCHTQSGFETRHFDRHEEYFPLIGAHGEQACLDCHEPESPRSIAAHMAGESPTKQRDCAQCHAVPHSREFIIGNSLAADTSAAAVCASCHDSQQFTFQPEDPHIGPEQHAHSGFALAEQHAELECSQCHERDSSFEERFPGRGPDECIACHESPHGEQFVRDGYSDNNCVACHSRTHFEPHNFTPDLHAEVALELTGKHAEIECASCHDQKTRAGGLQFMGTPMRCEGCHSDAHLEFFEERLEEVEVPETGECATCHSTSDFQDTSAGMFEHSSWTGFELGGAHAQNNCESCHQVTPQENEHGRSFGYIAEHFGQVQDCSTCHTDVHEGRFDHNEELSVFQDREGCLRCHGENSFRELPFGFNHGLWTGFRLEGQHKEADCSACHALVRPDKVDQNGGRSWSPARGNECAACHSDPHASQFVQTGVTDCARCHRAGADFEDLVFRHNIDSQFALDDSHASLECAACHKPTRVKDRRVIRYRPLGTNCADCHGMKTDAFGKKREGR